MSAMTVTSVDRVLATRTARRQVVGDGVSRPAPVGAGRLRLTARGRAVVVGLVVLVGAVLMLRAPLAAAGPALPGVPVHAVTVSSGETLWGLASSVTGPGEDVRDVLDRIVELNALSDSTVHPGQQLLVPGVLGD
jgi:hypothetical protein